MGASARATKFDCQDMGGMISVEEYFRRSEFPFHLPNCFLVLKIDFSQEYNRNLRYPDLPVVTSEGRTGATFFQLSYARLNLANHISASLTEWKPQT